MHRPSPSPWLLFLCGILLSALFPPSGQIATTGQAHAATRPAASAPALPPAPASVEPALSHVGGLGAIIETAAISGTLAYAGEFGMGTLVILDVSNPAQPSVVARLNLSGRIMGIQVRGDLLYVANIILACKLSM